MKNIAIVNLINISDYFFKDIQGTSQIDRIGSYTNKLKGVDKILYLVKEPLDCIDKGSQICHDLWNREILIEVLYNLTIGFDHLFYFYGDCPLLDSDLSNQMFDDHIQYYAEYTFADGYPYGLAPEIIDVSIIEPLKLLVKESKDSVDRDSIFEIIKKDINSFELETTIAPKDQRLLRISLTNDTKRNYNQLLRVIERGGNTAEQIQDILEKYPEDLLLEPSYITIEIGNNRIQPTSYLPERSVTGNNIVIEKLNLILERIKEYSDDATISFVPEYEPTTHPDLISIIKEITGRGFTLYIETSGLGWTKELVDEFESNNLLNVIVTLDAITPELYREIRGKGMEEAYSLAKLFVEKSRERVWVQAIRMKSNETDMEQFFRYWQEITPNIIIQKYSNYCGRLEDLKLADLSPLKRFPCWHIKRDLHILENGNIQLCPFDISREYKLGNILNNTLEDIQKNRLEYYKKHISEDYPKLCRSCDEYYTFNF